MPRTPHGARRPRANLRGPSPLPMLRAAPLHIGSDRLQFRVQSRVLCREVVETVVVGAAVRPPNVQDLCSFTIGVQCQRWTKKFLEQWL